MIRRALTWVADRLMDSDWLTLWRVHEDEATQAARRTERQAEGLYERVAVPNERGSR